MNDFNASATIWQNFAEEMLATSQQIEDNHDQRALAEAMACSYALLAKKSHNTEK